MVCERGRLSHKWPNYRLIIRSGLAGNVVKNSSLCDPFLSLLLKAIKHITDEWEVIWPDLRLRSDKWVFALIRFEIFVFELDRCDFVRFSRIFESTIGNACGK